MKNHLFRITCFAGFASALMTSVSFSAADLGPAAPFRLLETSKSSPGVLELVSSQSGATQNVQELVTVKVFGCVEKPGAYTLTSKSSLLDALGAAGGWTRLANLEKVIVLRGLAEEAQTRTIYDLSAILKGEAVNPALQSGDAVYLEEKVF
jgi:protein involved in polysaccharide export with SLBB domain